MTIYSWYLRNINYYYYYYYCCCCCCCCCCCFCCYYYYHYYYHYAIHAIFEADETDDVLLIEASNALNALNRQAALHNIRVQCPIIATYAINTYRLSARLFITGGQEILSAEGTTQSDPLAMALYALSIQPLITSLQGALMQDQAMLVC